MRGRVFAISVGLVVLASTPALAQPNDPRARDAVDFFGGMCGRIVANWEPPVDHEQFRFAWLSQRHAASLGEDLKDFVVWSVEATGSDVFMVHYVTPRGICGVEVEAADLETVGRAFEALVQAAAKALSLKAAIRSDDTSEGRRTRIWRLGQAGEGYDIGLSSPIDSEAPPQFIMTMAEAPEDNSP
jgi:hypothetical protein